MNNLTKRTALKILIWVFALSVILSILLPSCQKEKINKATISVTCLDKVGGVTVKYNYGRRKEITSSSQKIPFTTEIPVASNGSITVECLPWGGLRSYTYYIIIEHYDGSRHSEYREVKNGNDSKIKISAKQ